MIPIEEDKEEDLDDLFENYKEEQAEIKAATERWEKTQTDKSAQNKNGEIMFY